MTKAKIKTSSYLPTLASVLLIFAIFKYTIHSTNGDLSGIGSRNVRVEGEHVDHKTTSMAQPSFRDIYSFYFFFLSLSQIEVHWCIFETVILAKISRYHWRCRNWKVLSKRFAKTTTTTTMIMTTIGSRRQSDKNFKIRETTPVWLVKTCHKTYNIKSYCFFQSTAIAPIKKFMRLAQGWI